MKIQFVAFDGKVFDNEADCLNYENNHFVPKHIVESVEYLSTFCGHKACAECPFGDKNSEPNNVGCRFHKLFPNNWDIIIGDLCEEGKVRE